MFNASYFNQEWKGETREAAERQSSWNDFFNVFGVRRRTVATFEELVKKLTGDWGFIDLFWPGRLLAEHSSAGETSPASPANTLVASPETPRSTSDPGSEVLRGVSGGIRLR